MGDQGYTKTLYKTSVGMVKTIYINEFDRKKLILIKLSFFYRAKRMIMLIKNNLVCNPI